MSKADDAVKAAQAMIEKARQSGATKLEFDTPETHALTTLPPEIASLDRLAHLALDNTAIADLTPLQGLTALQRLTLDQTQVSDLIPLQGLTALQWLTLNQTQVSDLTPLQGLTALQLLYLDQTQVADLTPLQGLTALQVLTLNQTQVSDLTPLQGLTALQRLTLNQTQVSDLTPLRGLTALQELTLDQTQVSDLTPLQGLTALQELTLDQTQVADLTPLQGLTALQELWLDNTQITDLRPVLHLPRIAEAGLSGIDFAGTPIAAATPELTRLSQIEYRQDRTQQTQAYFAPLPPWPDPLPWEGEEAPAPQTEMAFADDNPVTVTALLEAQDLAGWRFSPTHGSLVLYVQDLPTDARQSQLAKMAADRAAHLMQKLGNRINQGGLRQEVAEEAQRFSDILADANRPLSVRSIELWGSLVALGSQLEENDQGRRDGRDPLDLLTNESRASLQTLLGIAASLVRSFPEARELDDDHGTFDRRAVTPEMLLEVFESALKAAFIDERSAALVQHVAEIATHGGKQALKAEGVTVSGSKNLVLTAALIGGLSGAVGGVTSGILNDIGTDISDHYELSEKAIDFIESSKDQINNLLDQLTPDERARLRSSLEDALEKSGRDNPGIGPQ